MDKQGAAPNHRLRIVVGVSQPATPTEVARECVKDVYLQHLKNSDYVHALPHEKDQSVQKSKNQSSHARARTSKDHAAHGDAEDAHLPWFVCLFSRKANPPSGKKAMENGNGKSTAPKKPGIRTKLVVVKNPLSWETDNNKNGLDWRSCLIIEAPPNMSYEALDTITRVWRQSARRVTQRTLKGIEYANEWKTHVWISEHLNNPQAFPQLTMLFSSRD